MRILFGCGGTAGHINPALAIADTVKRNMPHAQIAFVGVRGGKEEDLIPREGYPLYFVRSRGIRRSFSLSNLGALCLALFSPYARDTVGVIREFSPDLVIGTGGYACWPILRAAARYGIPTALHESNAFPGLTVRALEKTVDAVWLNFGEAAKRLKHPEKALVVGNPLRGNFGTVTKEEARRKLGIGKDRTVILSFGGSLGAEKINEAALGLMKNYVAQRPELLYLHACGKGGAAEMKEKFREAGLSEAKNCVLKDYIYEMPLWMTAADLVISRAGAMTLSELARLGKASILIPSPNVTDNHQYRNAKVFSDAHAAILMTEEELNGDVLLLRVRELTEKRDARETLERKIAAFADPEADRRIYREICRLLGKKG